MKTLIYLNHRYYSLAIGNVRIKLPVRSKNSINLLKIAFADVRIDYKLNPASNLNSALLNIVFSTKIDSSIDRVVSEPEAQW